MKRSWLLHAARWLAVVLLAATSALSALLFAVPAPLAHAAGDTLALSITNGSGLTYGVAPNFTAVVTFGVKPTTSPKWQVKVQIEGGESFLNANAPTQSADGMTLTFTGLHPANPVSAGAHTATAQFTNPETGLTATDTVSFTVNKATVALACAITMTGRNVIGVGKPISVQMTPSSGNGSLPSEWLTGTFTVKLDGPTHATYSNLTATSSFAVTATAPAQNGLYNLTCTFNGSANYTSSSFTSSSPYTISSLHALGTVQLYSNPTTLTAGQKIDYYVVFQPASGLPTPSGQFTLSFGSHHTSAFTLGSAGTFLIYFGTITSLAGVTDIQVFYMGDVNYDQATVHFPLTNQPIPPGIDGGPGGNAQATTTTTATTTETPGAETATPTAASAAGAVPPPSSDTGTSLGPILIAAFVIMLLLGVLGGGAIIVIYRMRRVSADDDGQVSSGYPATTYGRYGQNGQNGQNGQFGRSGQYRQYGQSAQMRQVGRVGQMGETGPTARYQRPAQYGQNGQTGKHRQPGQYGQSGLTGRYRQPGQYGQGQTGKHRQYRERGAYPDDDS